MSSKVKSSDLDRITYRDYKGFFSVLVDNNQRKTICAFKLSETKKILLIGSEQYAIENVDVKTITNFKREISDSATIQLED